MKDDSLNQAFNMRMTRQDELSLERIAKAYRVDSLSQAVRILIREAADRLSQTKQETASDG